MLIHCPECGHEVSNKAPVCPHCGIEIAVKVTTPSAPTPQPSNNNANGNEKGKSSNGWIYFFCLLVVLALCGVGYYYYDKAKNNDEMMAFDSATQSNDISVMQEFLDTYRDAPRIHRDSVQRQISILNQSQREWTDAVVSNTRSALENYIESHPESEHKAEALHKLDSIDWSSARKSTTQEAVQAYIDRHPNGDYINDAEELIKNICSTIVQPEERKMLESIFRSFFQSVNSKDADRLVSTVGSLLSTFLGKHEATPNDVVTFMKKLWREDVQNLNWHIIDDYKIDKKQVGEGEFEYSVTFSATQQVEKVTGTTNNKYRIRAKVNSDGKISEMNMSKVIE